MGDKQNLKEMPPEVRKAIWRTQSVLRDNSNDVAQSKNTTPTVEVINVALLAHIIKHWRLYLALAVTLATGGFAVTHPEEAIDLNNRIQQNILKQWEDFQYRQRVQDSDLTHAKDKWVDDPKNITVTPQTIKAPRTTDGYPGQVPGYPNGLYCKKTLDELNKLMPSPNAVVKGTNGLKYEVDPVFFFNGLAITNVCVTEAFVKNP